MDVREAPGDRQTWRGLFVKAAMSLPHFGEACGPIKKLNLDVMQAMFLFLEHQGPRLLGFEGDRVSVISGLSLWGVEL